MTPSWVSEGEGLGFAGGFSRGILDDQPSDEFEVGFFANLLPLVGQDEAAGRLEAGGGTLAEGGGDGRHRLVQEGVVVPHIAAVVGLLIEEVAELGIGLALARTEDAVDVEDLLRVRETETDVAVGEDVDQKVGLERIDGRAGIGLGLSLRIALPLLPETEDNAGGDDLVLRMRRHAGIEAERSGFERFSVGLDVFQEFEPEIVEREFRERDAVVQVFDIEDFVFELEKLLVAIAEVFGDDVFDLLVLQDVVLEGGGDVHEGHAGFDPVLEVDVLVEIFGGPEIDELHGAAGAVDTVDAAEALDDAHGIPVDVVIDEIVAILQVLAFADAVSGDQQVDLALLGHGGDLGAVLRHGGEIGEDLVEGTVAERGAGVAAPTDQGHVDSQLAGAPREERLVEIDGGVGERGEDEHLPVRLAVLVEGRVRDLGRDEPLEFGQLGVRGRRDVLRGVQQDAELVLVFLDVFEPVLAVIQLQVFQPVLELAADEHGLFEFVVMPGVIEGEFKLVGLGVLSGRRQEIADFAFQVLDFGDRVLHRDFERLHRAFEALEEIHLHHADEVGFAVGLGERIVVRSLIEGLELVFDVLRGVKQGQLVARNLVVQLVIGKEAPAQIDLGVEGDRLLALRETAEGGNARLVILLDVFARAGDGQFVKQLEKGSIELLHQLARLALRAVFLGPEGEDLLRGGERLLQTCNADGLRKSVVAVLGQKIELVAEVFEVVVDGRRGKQEHLGADAGFDDVIHEALIAALADENPLFIPSAGGVVAKIMGLVDNDKVEVAPVEGREIDVTGIALVPAEVRVRKHVKPETVLIERIEAIRGAVNGPVSAKLLRAKHEDALVFQLKILDHREGLVGLAQADAVRNDAAIVLQDLVDSPFDAVALKLKKRFPDPRLKEAGLPQICVRLACIAKELFEDVVERLVIDELGGVIVVKLLEIAEDILFDILDERRARPQFIEPLLEFLPVAVAVNNEVQFEVVVAITQAEATNSKIGAAEDRVLHAGGGGDMVHFAMQEVGPLDGLDVHLALDPIGALLGDALLLELIGQFQSGRVDHEGLLLGLARVESVNKGRLAEQEIKVADTVQGFLERVIGVNSEIGGNDRQMRVVLDFRAQEISHGAARVIITDVRQYCGHNNSPRKCCLGRCKRNVCICRTKAYPKRLKLMVI